MRQVVLDTETTGLEPSQGHRIIEIGCVELVDRKLTGRSYHQYINPKRDIEDAAVEVHGITNEFLADKPVFAQCADEFKQFIEGAELVIHNAAFDVGFMDAEFKLCGAGFKTAEVCGILDTLGLARKKHPGQKNNLDALCRRYDIDNSHRDLHGALLDAEILADVYLLMTGGQLSMSLGGEDNSPIANETIRRVSKSRVALKVIAAGSADLSAHEEYLQKLEQRSGTCVWLTDQ